MLSKPGSTIRKLVSPRKTLLVGEYEGSYFHHDNEGYRSIYRELKTRSWGLRRGSKLDLDVPKKEDLHKILTIIPPLPNTPLSSRSSLSSCGYSTDYTSPQCSSQRVGGPSPQRSPLLCPEHLEHQPQQAQERSEPSSTTPRTPPRTTSTQELHQINLLPPSPPLQQDEWGRDLTIRQPDITLTGLGVNHQSIYKDEIAEGYTGSQEHHRLPCNEYSNDIPQLNLEMDRAFQPEQSPIEIKQPLPALVIPPITYYSANHTKPLTPVHSPSQWDKARRRSQASLQSFTQPSKRSFLLTSPARFASVSRTKRKKSKKLPRRPRIVSTQVSKWVIPDTARNFFQLFNPIEADEVLPESILQEIMDRACLTQSTMDDEVTATGQEGDQPSQQPITPIEPFHLDDLPTRIDNAGVSLPVASATLSLATARPSLSDHGENTRDDCATPKEQSRDDGQKQSRPRSPPIALAKNGKEHSLPIMLRRKGEEAQHPPIPSSVVHLTPSIDGPIKPVPRRTPSRQLPPLPTIPEGITSSIMTPTSTSSPGFGSDTSNDDFIFLKSTPYTGTMPSFRHGPIRLPKPEPPINLLAANAEDGLDWVAFQISIGSGIGDFDSDPLDYSRPSGAELNERDDIIAWFSGFGFDGYGALRTFQTAEEEIEVRKHKQENAPLHARSASSGSFLNMDSPEPPDSDIKGRVPTMNELYRIQHWQASDRDRKHSHGRSASVNDQLPFRALATHIAAQQTQQPPFLLWTSQETHSSTWPIDRQSRGDHPEKPATNTPYGHTHSQSWSYSPPPFPALTSDPTVRWDHSRGRSSSDVANNNTNTNNTPVPTSINRNQSPTLRTSTLTKTLSRSQPPHTQRHGTPQDQVQQQQQQQQQQQPQGSSRHHHHHRRRSDSQESIKSLPQSPALNMVVSRDVNGQEYVIPMGFNLDHDLGDFLKWEAEHVAWKID
ncbi:hypothetical protein QR685DRAFT_27550 [Neurospora intermedia]|uniref:Uncharacterized protein n=1 Tax=Neurospora intermedia TaxID=5142 RepID=A0ABR3DQH1_NEUIN